MAKPRLIKKYPNRRLYDTDKSAYITLSDVTKLLRKGEDIKVVDADTDEDITRSILIQIITEQEGGSDPLFSTDALACMIRFYGDASGGMFADFFEKSLGIFLEQQKKFSTLPPLQMMQDMAEKNMAMWQKMQSEFFSRTTPEKKASPKKKRKK